MSLIQQLNETQKSSNNNMRNIALKLTAYDNDKFKGTDIETGESIEVVLRDVSAKTSTYKRPSIKDFQNPGSLVHTEVGGTVIIDGCYKTADNAYSGRWANSVSKNDKQATTVIGMTKLASGVSKYGKKWMKADFAKTNQSLSVKNDTELKDNLIKFLTPATKYSNQFVIVNITEGTEFASSIITQGKNKNKEGYNETMNGNDSFNEFIKNHQHSDLIVKAANEESVNVELIPVTAIFAGPATLDNYFKNEAERIRLDNQYKLDIETDEEQKFEIGYVKSIVVVRKHSDGSPFLTHCKPVSSNEKIQQQHRIKNNE